MNTFWLSCDGALRGRVSAGEEREALPRLALVVGVCGLFYGSAMGCFGLRGENALQVLFSGLKVPLLLGVTGGFCLPPFWVMNTLLGLRDDWTRVLRALLSTQAVLSLVLASLAPFTLLCYASTTSYRTAIMWNALMFAVASLTAQQRLRHHYRPLLERDPRHRPLLVMWLLLYGFVGVQMSWLLRPFIGDPNATVTFLRPGAWSNAYEVLWRLAMG